MKMPGKTVTVVALALLLVDLWTLSLNVQPVKATGTIFIRLDGTVDPATAPINSFDGVTYTFVGNISDEIVVERNGIIIDGAGFTLQGVGALNSTGIHLSGVSDVTVKRTNIVGFFSGIKLDWSANNDLVENNMTNNDFGIWLHESVGNTITSNNIQGGYAGVNLAWSRSNMVLNNNVTGNEYGVVLHWSSNNAADGNNLEENGVGLSLAWSGNNNLNENHIVNSVKSGWYGARLHASQHNTITRNIMKNSLYGIKLLYESSKNVITRNNITDSFYGVSLWYSSNNTIHHNNFINNTRQVDNYESTNSWDDDYPSGGNYWNDYLGVDEKSGPGQDQPGSDGIGDDPYIIDGNNRDRYPIIQKPRPPPFIMNPFLPYLTLMIIAAAVGIALFLVRKGRANAPHQPASVPEAV